MAAVENMLTDQASIQTRRHRAAIEDGLAHNARIFPLIPAQGSRSR